MSESPSLSDHAFIKFDVIFHVKGGRFIRNTKAVDWSLFRLELSRLLPTENAEITSREDIDLLSQCISTALHDAYNAACPLKWVRYRSKKTPWWTPGLSGLRKETRRLLRIAKRTRHLVDWEAYNGLQRHYKREIELAKKKSWQDFCDNLNDVHPIAKVFRALKDGRSVGPQSLKKPDGTYTRGPGDTLDYLLGCVSPVIGTEYVEPPNGWTWDGGADLLKDFFLSCHQIIFPSQPLSISNSSNKKTCIFR